MAPSIHLNEQEATLKQLLLDTSVYIGTLPDCKKPELRFTGGWVRDKLLGSTSHDIDIGIDTMTGFRFGTLMKEYLALPETKKKYKQDVLGGLAKIAANPEKSKHLETVTTKILGLEIDLVNLRKETYTEHSRNPIMEFGTAEEDALRRESTVNALFYNLSTSEVEDFTKRGLKDMQRKLIKTPLEPLQTFKDDPLRVLRCIRFASRLGYEISAEDQRAMRNDSIKDALRLKISRERVGIEITKMLKGPKPLAALALIDQLGLYNTIFTVPKNTDCEVVAIGGWSRAYDQYSYLANTSPPESISYTSLELIKEILIRNEDDIFLGWMLVCFIPWARVVPKAPEKSTTKQPVLPAILAAREGIDANNTICGILNDAVNYMSDVIAMKDATTTRFELDGSSLKRKRSTVSREDQGKAIRRWGVRKGASWRHTVMYALLTQITETNTIEELKETFDDYTAYLSELRSLDLLDADSFKPLANGKQIKEALGVTKDGRWMQKATYMVMEWQLQNPEETDPARVLAVVVERREELEIP